jgi:hypothetical protein
MKFMAKFMLILGLFAVILAGCGTSQMDRMDKSKLKNRIHQKRALWMKDRA